MFPADVTTSLETEKEREYAVVKANFLVRKAHYSLTAQEQKLILYCISKIKPEDTEFQEYTFSMKELCDVLGITYQTKNYLNFKNSIQNLRNKSFWFETKDEEALCAWVQSAVIHKNDLSVTITLDERLKPYLLQLKNNYTQYSLKHILAMDSKYSIRLFEILQSYASLGKFEISLDDLKALLQIENNSYSNYKNFRVRVVDPAIEEINRYTYLNVSYQPIRQNRKIHSIIFSITKKKDITDRLAADVERDRILNRQVVNLQSIVY